MNGGRRPLLKRLAFSVGFKINLLFSLVVILFIAFSYYTVAALDRYSEAYDRQIATHSAVARLKASFAACGPAVADYFKTGNRIKLADFNRSFEESKAVIRELSLSVADGEALYLLRSVALASETYFRECSTASFMYNTRNFAYTGKLHYADSILAYLQKYCDELTGIILVGGVAENAALGRMRAGIRAWTRVLNGALVAILLGGLLYVSSRVTVPMERLAAQARAISAGNFDVRVRTGNPNNSVGMLAETFNSMAESVKTMMNEVHDKVATEKKLLEERRKNVEYRELLNQATFLALQTQTNPHFLFNTLSSISRSVTLGRKEQTLTMIDALASLLRYSLADASEPVLLKEELAATEEYLKIQTVRFRDRLRIEFRVEGGAERSARLPRFTLQPLVENAVVHGLEPKETGGKLVISARKRGRSVVLRVFDDGAGIPPETLRLIRERRNQNLSKRIGVWNTDKRLRIFTQSDDSFRIASRASGGTLVTVTLPLREDADA